MKREEAQALIRKMKMSCKGPWKPISQELVEKVTEKVKGTLPSSTVLKSLIDAKTIQPVAVALLRNNEGELARQVERMGRQRCGYDFTITIANGPLDGSAQDYKCPKCGLEGHYTAPRFEIED